MKKISTIALLLLMMVAMVFAMTACNDPEDTTGAGEIYVEEGGMPQLQYVRGEELDLSNGMLSVKENGEVRQIPMSDTGISVSGYNKDTLGEQTITITYQGMTTQLKVTVVDRMQMIEHVTDYLLGDALDTSKGRLKITRNDGSNYTALLNSQDVEITGYDPSKVGTQTLTAKYTGNDVSYTCQFTVTVHAVEEIVFHAPSKVNYNSHDEGIDLTDGYFALSGNGGKLVKNVPLTEKMVSGFDLSAVNDSNSPMNQKLTVTYNGQTYSYDVKLVYTDISLFKKEAAAFTGLNWSGNELPQYSAEMGEHALELMAVYLDLSKAEQTYITQEEKLAVARVAMMYGLEQTDDEFVALEGAFTIVGGALEFTCVSREALETAVELLGDDDNDIYRINPVLMGMVEAFENEEIITDVYFGDFGMLPNELYEDLLEVFEHMLDVHDALELIPTDWREVGVETYAWEIENFYDAIFSEDYVESGMSYIYPFVANWREEGDAFDVLYHYYYALRDQEALNSLAKVNLPSELSLIAYHATEMLSQLDLISNYSQMDATLLLYHYHSAVRLAEELKAGDDEMAKNLYNILPVNALLGISDSTLFSFDMLMEYLRTMEGGYYQFSGGLLGVKEYHDIMTQYMHLITNMLEDEQYENSDQYGADLEKLFAMFVDLKPTQQYYFLNTLNAFYSMSIPPLAFDDTGEFSDLMCFFVRLVNEYYRDKLSEGAASAYNDLVAAMELYAQRMNNENWIADFTARLDSVQNAYNKMSADDKAAFDQYLGTFYNKYVQIRDTYVLADDLIDLGEWEDEFEALEEAVLNVELSLSLIQKGQPYYGLFFSAYERAQSLADYILTNAPAEIVEAFYYEHRYGANAAEDGMGTDNYVAASYEYVMTTYRNMYINYLLTAVGPIYDAYMQSGMADFMNSCYDLSWNAVFGEAYDKVQVLSVMKSFRELSLEEKIMFIMLEGSNSYYYEGLVQFITQNYTEAAAAAATKLVMLEEQYILYNYFVENGADEEDLGEVLDALETALSETVAEYEALSAEDKASFADFEEMYTFYKNLCEQALAA